MALLVAAGAGLLITVWYAIWMAEEVTGPLAFWAVQVAGFAFPTIAIAGIGVAIRSKIAVWECGECGAWVRRREGRWGTR